MDSTLYAARDYHALGMSLIWLKEKSKKPVEFGWTSGTRRSWAELEKGYHPGMNLGLRLGTTSKIGKGYLACFDIDVRNKRYLDEAESCLTSALEACGLDGSLPQVFSGGGNDSRHLYFLTREPFRQVTYGKKKGCWEVVAYSEGRQMVLPPSVHPDTGKRYQWAIGTQTPLRFPLLRLPEATNNERARTREIKNWTKSVPGADLLVLELSGPIQDLIRTGKSDDRSATLVPVTRALLSVGASPDEILTILTDPQFGLSRCAYDHVQCNDRARAADWLWKYTVSRLVSEGRADGIFKPVSDETKKQIDAMAEAAQSKPDAWREKLRMDRERKKLVGCAFNIRLLIGHLVSPETFRLDEFSNRTFYGAGTPWGGEVGQVIADKDCDQIQHWLSEEFDMNVGPQLIWATISVIAHRNRFHPVRQYLRSLEWDGVSRVDTWLRDFLGAEMPEPYLTEVSRKVLLASVARILEPGVKFDHILVLEGAQGIGKSTAVQDLASQGWFLDHLPDIRDKDSLIAIQGKWWVEMAELDTLKNANSEAYKAFFSTNVDNFRKPYGRASESYPRQCIFVGSTNSNDYLSDNTGNRRFWPVKTQLYQWKSLERKRDQLFAEAVVLWETFREELFLTGEARAQALTMQKNRVSENEEDLMTDQFITFLEDQLGVPEEDQFDFTRFKLESLLDASPGPWRPSTRRAYQMMLAGRILKAQGFEKFVSSGCSWWRRA